MENTMLKPDRDRLKEILAEHSLMFGDFTLASGKKSKFYFDSKKTTLLPEGALLTALEGLPYVTRVAVAHGERLGLSSRRRRLLLVGVRADCWA